ncbi:MULTISPECIES: YkgJ family cysteine cluster protein [unclassified Archaeoglobus]|uniref:YkgJ family cysteine cluster protein n=1 Tax=unclassified Archaeoglobus TaxID=2643606 RepID=UPI0025C59152|nr:MULTISPECIES: YkgJ family cysteine cluster protein [unclassified Archaeoglobus]
MKLIPWRRVGNWKCIRCGKCCKELDVMVTSEEENRLRKFGDIFRRGKVLVYLKRVDGKCVFFRSGICAIYLERPMACVKYPFYFKSTGEEESYFAGVHVYVDSNCPGVVLGCPTKSFVDTIQSLLRNEKLIIV